MPRENRKRAVLAVALAAIASLCPAAPAAGEVVYGDLAIAAADVPVAETTYGYAAHPIRITNESTRERLVTIELEANEPVHGPAESISLLRRTVRVPPESEVVTRLLQPAQPLLSHEAVVTIDGRRQREPIYLSRTAHAGQHLLWGSRGQNHAILIDADLPAPLRDGLEAELHRLSEETATRSHSNPYVARFARDGDWEHAGEWLGLSRYLAIVMPAPRWNRLDPVVRAAIHDYVAAGGNLVVTGVSDWRDLAPDAAAIGPEPSPHPTARFALGRLVAIPAGETSADWDDLIDRFTDSAEWRYAAADRRTDVAHLPTDEYLSLPVRSLMAILLVFGLLIGPVNVLVLVALKRQVLLFLTTPVLGVFFAAAIFTFGIASDGTRPKLKSLTLTVLDQRAQLAVSRSLVAYYAPFTPSEGVAFSDRALVALPRSDEWSGAARATLRIEQTGDEQRFLAGLVRSRVPAYVRVLEVQTARQRVLIERDGSDLTVLNGFEADLESIWHATTDGRVYLARRVAACQRAALEDRTDAAALARVAAGWPESLTAVARDAKRSILGHLVRADPELPPAVIPRGGYVATLATPAFLRPGIERTRDHQSRNVVLGLLDPEFP